jgi:hypothetical protein
MILYFSFNVLSPSMIKFKSMCNSRNLSYSSSDVIVSLKSIPFPSSSATSNVSPLACEFQTSDLDLLSLYTVLYFLTFFMILYSTLSLIITSYF